MIPLPIYLLTHRETGRRTGWSHGKLYVEINAGRLPPGVRTGPRSVRWPSSEIDAVVQARVSGATDDALRELVTKLVAQRGKAAHD